MQHNAPNDATQQVSILFTTAKNEYQRGDFAKAAAIYDQVMKLDPTHAHAELGKARCSHQLAKAAIVAKQGLFSGFFSEDPHKHFAAAMEQAKKALALNPALSEAHLILGSVLGVKRSYHEAHQHFAKALELNPQENIHTERGCIFYAVDRLDEALADFQEATQKNPQDTKAWMKMISIYKKQNKKIERLECIARVSSLAQNGVADLFELLHNLPKAAVIEYIKKLPKHRSSWLIQFICQNYAAGLVSMKILSFSEPLKRLENDAILTLDAAKTLYQELFADNLAMAQMARRMVIAGRMTDPARLFFSGHHGLRVKIVAAAGQSLPEQEALAKAHKYLSIYEEKIPAKRHK